MAEGRRVSDQLVDHVGLRRVERPAGMPHVLRGEEHAAGEVAEEGAIADQAGNRLHAEAGRALEGAVHLGELRHPLAVELHDRRGL